MARSAPPTSRRSKQGSSPSSSPSLLPGIAIGIFAAVGAGFAATRALRKKRRLESQKDEEHAGNSILIHTRDVEINEKCDLNGTSARVPESAKLVADLELVVDALKVGLFVPESIAEDEEFEREEEDTEYIDGKITIKGDEKTAELAENSGEDGDITVKIKPLILDNTAAKALQESLLLTAEEDGEGEEESIIAVVEDEDTGEDGDDDRSSAGQPPSPVLINGKVLDFFEEMSDLSDKPDLLMSGGNSFSDSVSECSMQEVSSAPVKPLVIADEVIEASWMETKPNFFNTSDQFGQDVALEEKNWSGADKTSPIMKSKGGELLAEEETCPQVNIEGLGLNKGFADSSKELDVHAGKPVLIEVGDNAYTIGEGNKVNVEILSGARVACEGEFFVKLNKDEEPREHARINGKVLSDALPLTECKEHTSTKQLPHAAIESAHGLTLKNISLIEFPRINGTTLCDNLQNDSSLSIASNVDGGSLQWAQETAGYDALEAECAMTSQPSKRVIFDTPHADVEVEVLVESKRDMPALGGDGKRVLGFTSRGGNFDVDSPHATCDQPSFESVVNAGVEPNELSILKNVLESVASEENVCAEEPAMHDVIIADSIKDDNPNVHDMAGWEENVGISTDSPVEVLVDEMPSLEADLSEAECLHAELPAVQTGGVDVAMFENIEDDNSDLLDGRFEVEESTQELASLEGRSLEEFSGGEPGIRPGVLDTAVTNTIENIEPENNVDIEEQPGLPLPSLEDDIECNEPRVGASADEIELSSVMEDDEVAELGANSRTHTKQQEIEEISSTDDTSDDSKGVAPSTCSLPASFSTTRDLDQVYTKGAGRFPTRSRFSRKLLRHVPIEICLMCLLVALVSFLLQYLEGSMLIQW